jgi:hypothetical protein
MKKITGASRVIKKRIDYFLFKVSNTLLAVNIKYGYYDKHLDEINIRTEDCSFTEIYCGKRIALLKKNHVFGKKYIGFMIFGVRHFFLTHQIDMFEMQKAGDILKKMIELCPDNEFSKQQLKIIHKILRKYNVEVYIPPISK